MQLKAPHTNGMPQREMEITHQFWVASQCPRCSQGSEAAAKAAQAIATIAVATRLIGANKFDSRAW